ncbi:ATP-dependent Clp protease ATP-binding subunit [Treponema bryantii]|uniref:ATP-dependent Clp protease ATP-binding subunit n=1 Tax=Treponema bryantii TaxID=163 RepID=UPI0003B5CE0F|nr:ATP-dependent Clp protease ATP-binding subunit [Treponema bryantii]
MKNLSPRAKKILMVLAQDEARKIGSNQLLPEHVLLAILKSKEGLGYSAIAELGLDADKLQQAVETYFRDDISSPTLDSIPKSRRYQFMIDIADIESAALHNNYIGTEHLLLAAVRDEGSVAAKFFTDEGYTIMDLRFTVMELQADGGSSIRQQNAESLVDSVFRSLLNDDAGGGLFGVFEEKKSVKKQPADKSNSGQKQSFLAEYSRDLTKLARENKDDPVVGRDKEIHRVIQILSRRTKNNPVLTGEPGVGKTAIVEGLAQHIAAGKVPEGLLNKRILSLDLAAIVAGTKYRGEFEERMKKMMKELQENKDIILFIDELHTIIGAGGPEGTMDASNIMKPALSRGEIQIIGATTTKEYTRHIEKDLALERRFQVVKVEEPGDEETEEILNGIKTKYENYHRVIYDDAVIPAIVKLSRRYIPEKVLPDKAIDILDEAGAAKKIQEEARPTELAELEQNISQLIEEKQALVKNQDYESAALVRDKVIDLKRRLNVYSDLWKKNGSSGTKRVSVSDVERIISEMTGVPVERLSSSEAERIVHMEDELHNTVIGQNAAVSVISGAIRRARAGISSPKHPVGSFIFLGPTGVGKTQLAKALAKYLFGSEDSLIRIDMSDYMEKHTASRLVGAPPGYVGYEEGGVLTEKVRRHPYSVVLLDEIEKAHPDIFNLLLQLLEEGELSDNLGHTVNFRNTVIIMTSNAGARQITNEGRVGFGTIANADGVMPYEEIKAGAMNELKKLLSPELINRIDDVIVFDALSKKEVAKILDIQLAELEERLKEKGLTISLKPKAKEYLIENGYNPAMGARPMKRLLRKEIEDPLSMELLSNAGKDFNTVAIECNSGKIKVKLEKVEVKESVVSIRPLGYSTTRHHE